MLGPLLLVAATWGFVAGCESMESVRNSVRDRFVSVPAKTHTVAGDVRQVYDAARIAMEKLGYEQTSGGPAQGRLEGLSRIGGGNDFRSSRQRAIAVHLQPMEGGQMLVEVLLTEIVEEGFGKVANPATETSLRDSPGYDAFFEELDRQLQGIKGKQLRTQR